MRVLIYTHEFPPFCGGAGTYSYDLATGLNALGVEVHVATPYLGEKRRLFPGTTIEHGIWIHHMAKWQTGHTLAHLFLLHLQQRYLFDLVIVSERRAQEIVATLPRRSFRYAAVIHGSEILVYFGGKKAHLAMPPQHMARFYEQAEIGIAVSNATLQLAQDLLKGKRVKLAAVQNGINLNRLEPAIAEDTDQLRQAYGEDAEIVFCLGRLDLDKGQDVLISAFDKVRHARPKARLLIGGDGPHMARLKKLRDTLGLDDCVEFIGSVPQSKLPAYFDLCDVFALTSKSESRWEGFGLVYLEAAYYGKASIGGNEGGVPEAISHMESGLIVNPRDPLDIASAITTLLSDKKLRTNMGANGKRRVLTFFNSERMAAETLGHFKKTLASPPPSNLMSPGLALARWMMIELPSTPAKWVARFIRNRIGYV